MDSTERKDNAEDPFLPPHSAEPPGVSPSSPTVISAGLKLDQKQIDEALIRARKKLTDEDFVQALSIVDTILQVEPDLETAKALRDQIQDSASHHYRQVFQQGVSCYM